MKFSLNKRHIVIVVLFLMVIIVEGQWYLSNESVKIDGDWEYYSNQYMSPFEFSEVSGQNISLNDLKGNLFNIGGQRIRGTLTKSVTLPENWVGEKLVIFQRAFLENVKIYVNGQIIHSQGAFTVEGATGKLSEYEPFISFATKEKSVEIMILFDQNQQNMIFAHDLYIMPLDHSIMTQYVLTVMETACIFLCIVLMYRFIKVPAYASNRKELLSLVALLLLRTITVSLSPSVNELPLSIGFWEKLGLMTFIILSFYVLLLMFEKRQIWAEKMNILMAVYTFLMALNIIVFDVFQMSLILLVHSAIIIALYTVKAKYWLKAPHVSDVIIVNLFLIFDVFYQMDLIYPPIHLAAIAIYFIFWGDEFKMNVTPIDAIADVSAVNEIEENEQILLTNNIFKEALLPVVFVKSDLTFDLALSEVMLARLNVTDETRTLPDVFYPNDLEKQHFANEMMLRLFHNEKVAERAVYMELLPKRIYISNRYYAIDYTWSKSLGYLVVKFEEVTEQVATEETVKKLRSEVELITVVVKQQRELLALEEEFVNFIRILEEQKKDAKASSIDVFFFTLEKIKYFKDQFSRLKLMSLAGDLSKVEQSLDMILKNNAADKIKDFEVILTSFNFEAMLTRGMVVIEKFLPDWRERKQSFIVDEAQINSLLDVVTDLPDETEKNSLLQQIFRIKHFSFEEVVKGYDGYVQDFARSIGKKMHPIEIGSNRILFDRERYSYFSNGCMALISNALLHGIERPDVRLRKGKSEYGIIRVHAFTDGESIMIEVSDDGRGLDINQIKAKLTKRYPDAFESITSLTDNEIIAILLGTQKAPHILFKIADHDNGLIRIREQVVTLGGDLTMRYDPGVGTTVVIKLPNVQTYMAI